LNFFATDWLTGHLKFSNKNVALGCMLIINRYLLQIFLDEVNPSKKNWLLVHVGHTSSSHPPWWTDLRHLLTFGTVSMVWNTQTKNYWVWILWNGITFSSIFMYIQIWIIMFLQVLIKSVFSKGSCPIKNCQIICLKQSI